VHGFQAIGSSGTGSSLAEEEDLTVAFRDRTDNMSWLGVLEMGDLWRLSYLLEQDRAIASEVATGDDTGTETTVQSITTWTTSHGAELHGIFGPEDDGLLAADFDVSLARTSDAVPAPGSLARGYADLWRSLFSPPDELSGRNYRLSLEVGGDPARTLTAELAARSTLQEDSFSPSGTERAVGSVSSIDLRVPLRLGNERSLVVTPSITRSVSADMASLPVSDAALARHGQVSLFGIMPPAYYLLPDIRVLWGVSPGASAGRINEVAALDSIVDLGARAASLGSEAGLGFSLKEGPWYLPGKASVSMSGASSVQGSDFSQVRAAEARVGSTRLFGLGTGRPGTFVLDGTYEFQRDYRRDIDEGTLSTSLYVGVSHTSGRSWQISYNGTWTHTRQHIQDPLMVLFLEDPAREMEPVVVEDRDTIHSSLSAAYVWGAERVPRGSSPLSRRLGIDPAPQRVTNTERVSAHTVYTIGNIGRVEAATCLPVQITLEHASEIEQTEFLSLRIGLKLQGGVEERIADGVRQLLPEFGGEARMDVIISY
jgi:hypothetical protein